MESAHLDVQEMVFDFNYFRKVEYHCTVDFGHGF